METGYNRIANRKTFEVSAFVSAYYFPTKPDFIPYWEEYDFSQMFLVLSGTGVLKTEETEYVFRPGMLVYRPAGKRSLYEWTGGNVRFALISFVCDSPAMKALEGAPFVLGEEESSTLLDVMKTGAQICESVDAASGLKGMRLKEGVPDVVLHYISASLERFLTMVYCRRMGIGLLMDESSKVSRSLGDSRLVTGIRAYLEEHRSERITVAELCERFWVSPASLTRKFRAETGQSVMQYLTELKISEAKRRIRSTPDSFTEISEALGFSSLNYFSKVFRQSVGMTPTQYSRFVSKRRAAAKEEQSDSRNR